MHLSDILLRDLIDRIILNKLSFKPDIKHVVQCYVYLILQYIYFGEYVNNNASTLKTNKLYICKTG